MTSWRANYTTSEVTGLLREYADLVEKEGVHSDGAIRTLVRLTDVRSAIPHLSDKQREAVLLLGIAGYTSRTAAERLGISESSVRARFDHAVERLTEILNRGGS